jgi:hypothetical protein
VVCDKMRRIFCIKRRCGNVRFDVSFTTHQGEKKNDRDDYRQFFRFISHFFSSFLIGLNSVFFEFFFWLALSLLQALKNPAPSFFRVLIIF